MPYIGKQLVRGQNRKLDDISSGFNGSQTTFTLQVASQNVTVGSALQLWISVGGVIQNPLTDFTIAGNQITFTTAPAASLDFFGVIQGDVTDTNTPGDATVTTSKLATGLTVNLADGSAATSSLQLGGTDSGLFSSAVDKVNVTTGGVERVEIGDSEVVFNDPSNDVDFRVESNNNPHILFVDAGNDHVGIGESSPGNALHVSDNFTDAFVNPTDAILKVHNKNTSGTTTQASIAFTSSTSGSGADSAIVSQAADGSGNSSLQFWTDTSNVMGEKVRIDSSGDIDLSIAAANNATRTVSLRSDYGGGTFFDNAALALVQDTSGSSGGHLRFLTTASGGASPTERMRIDSSGNVGIGISNPSSYYQHGDNLVVGATGTSSGITIRSGSTNQGILAFADGTSGGSQQYAGYLIYDHNINNLLFATSATERMRIDSSGRLLIGTTTEGEGSADDLTIANAGNCGITLRSGSAFQSNIFFSDGTSGAAEYDGYIAYNQNARHMVFGTAQTESMRIDSSGHLAFGSSSTTRTQANRSIIFTVTTNSDISVNHSTQNSSGDFYLSFGYNGTVIGSVTQNGTTAVSYNTTSDYRLKENVVDLDGAIDRVKQLAPKRFNFIVDADKTVDGFLAHEAQTVVPEAVTGTHNEVDGDGNAVMQGIDQSKLVPLLTAALQEAIAKIETLEAKVAALEAE